MSMMQLRIQQLKQVVPKSISTYDLLCELHNRLDRENYFGTILLKYESGKLMYVKTEQGFTVDELTKSLIL